MGAVAERRIPGVFALAPPDGLFLGDFEFHRLQAGSLVGAVTKRLVSGPPARAPPMDASLNFKRKWLRIANNRFLGHEGKSAPAPASARDRNREPRGFLQYGSGRGIGWWPYRSRRVFVEFRISLGGHRVNECHREPTEQDDRRTTDEMTELHRNITEIFRISWPFSAPNDRKRQPLFLVRGWLVLQKDVVLTRWAWLDCRPQDGHHAAPQTIRNHHSHGHF